MLELEAKALKIIAEEGELSAYALMKKTKASYSTCHLALRMLEEKGLVRVKEVSAGSRGGSVKIYVLTEAGLIEAILSGWRGEGAEKHAHIDPVLFGGWSSLSKAVPREELGRALWAAAVECILRRGEGRDLVGALREGFFTAPFISHERYSVGAWVSAIKGEPAARKAAIEALEALRKRLKSQRSIVEWALKVLEGD